MWETRITSGCRHHMQLQFLPLCLLVLGSSLDHEEQLLVGGEVSTSIVTWEQAGLIFHKWILPYLPLLRAFLCIFRGFRYANISDKLYPGLTAPELAVLGSFLNPRRSQAQACMATLCFWVVRKQETEIISCGPKPHSKNREPQKCTQESLPPGSCCGHGDDVTCHFSCVSHSIYTQRSDSSRGPAVGRDLQP